MPMDGWVTCLTPVSVAAVVTTAVAIARLRVAVTGFDIGTASITIGVAVVATFNVRG